MLSFYDTIVVYALLCFLTLMVNRATSGGHFDDVKPPSFRHLLIW